MPFNRELEDFAQAFSSGYAGAKSPNEREAEKLNLEKGRLEVGHLPTQYANEDAQAAATLESTNTTNKFNLLKLQNLPTELEQANKLAGLQIESAGQDVEAKKRAALREPIDNAHKDALFDLEKQHDQNLITEDEYKAGRRVIDDAYTDKINKLNLRKTEHELNLAAEQDTPERKAARDKVVAAEVTSAEAKAKLDALNASPESIARNEEIKKEELKKAKADREYQEALTAAKRLEIDNTFNFADFYINQAGSDVDFGTQAVPEGPASSTGVDPNTGMNTGAGPRIGGSVPGPTSAVDVPSTTTVASAAAVPPESPPGSEAIVGTFNPPDLVG